MNPWFVFWAATLDGPAGEVTYPPMEGWRLVVFVILLAPFLCIPVAMAVSEYQERKLRRKWRSSARRYRARKRAQSKGSAS